MVLVAIAGCGGDDSDDTTSASSDVVIQLASVPGLGRVLVNGSGQTLYRSGFDVRGESGTHCEGGCTKIWHPELTNAKPEAGPGVQAWKIGTFKRKDGSLQATYDLWPLYTYTREEPGESKGVGLFSGGSSWYALRGARAVAIREK